MCESDTDTLTGPKDVLHSTETTGVPQSEKTSLLFPHPGGATPTNAYLEAEGTYIMTMKIYLIFILCLSSNEARAP